MLRKLLFTALLVVSTIFMAAPALAAKSYYAERFDVAVVIQPDGALIVTETIVYRFEGGPFTYVFRELTFKELDQIDRLAASMDGKELAQGAAPDQVEIAVGQPIKVTWHFEPASDSTHEFKLVYRVLGAIQKHADADTLIWRAIPEDHDYHIASSIIRLEYPPGVSPTAPPELKGYDVTGESLDQGIVFTLKDLEEDTLVMLEARFPPGSLVSQPPGWQAQQAEDAARARETAPYGISAAVLAGLAGLAGVILMGQRSRREGFIPPDSSLRITAPPKDIPPAIAVRLTGSGMGFLGTLFDLARRGVLYIEEGPKKWGSRTFEVVRQPGRPALRPHESAFLDALFAKAKADRVPLGNIASLAYDSAYSRALEEETTALGWIDPERKSHRTRFLALSILEWIMGLIFFLSGILILNISPETTDPSGLFGPILIGGGAGLVIIAFVGMIVAAVISPLSDEGVRQVAAWNSFTGYLRQITLGKEQPLSPGIFDIYLPYAAAFGIATEWAKFFQKLNDTPIPEWFSGLQGDLNDGSFVAIIAAISSADSSASVSSGGDGGAGSGGGSSGAG